MESLNVSTKELLTVLRAMGVAADIYEAEANRTPLGDIKKILRDRAKETREIAASLRDRAIDDSERARS